MKELSKAIDELVKEMFKSIVAHPEFFIAMALAIGAMTYMVVCLFDL